MAISLVVSSIDGSANGDGFTTDAIDTTGADLLVVAVADLDFFFTGTLSDSKSNTWTALTRVEVSSSEVGVVLYYAKNPTVGGSHTFTFSQTFNKPSIAIAAFSGADLTDPFDQENGTSPAGTTSSQPGSITPTEDNEVILAALSWEVAESGTVSVNSSMTITDQIDVDGSNHCGLALAYLVQTSAAAINPTWTSAVAQFKSAVIASFKEAGGGGGRTTRNTRYVRLGTRIGAGFIRHHAA